MEVGLVRRFSKTRKQFSFPERLGLCGMMDRSLSHRFLYTSLRQNLLQLLQIRKHSQLDDERNKFFVINYAPNRRQKHFTIVCLRHFVTTTWAASSRQSQHAETLLLHERFNLRFEPIYGKIPNEDDELSLQGKGCSSHAFLWRISDAGNIRKWKPFDTSQRQVLHRTPTRGRLFAFSWTEFGKVFPHTSLKALKSIFARWEFIKM